MACYSSSTWMKIGLGMAFLAWLFIPRAYPIQTQKNLCGLRQFKNQLTSTQSPIEICETVCARHSWRNCFREYVLDGDYAQALTVVNGFLGQNERDVMGAWVIRMGNVRREQGRTDDAIALATLTDDIQLRSSTPIYRLGLLWRELDEPHKAIAAFARAQQVDNVCPEMAQFRQAQIQYWHGLDKAQALENLQAVLQADCVPEDDRLSAAVMLADLMR